jgi:hypothetical protein
MTDEYLQTGWSQLPATWADWMSTRWRGARLLAAVTERVLGRKSMATGRDAIRPEWRNTRKRRARKGRLGYARSGWLHSALAPDGSGGILGQLNCAKNIRAWGRCAHNTTLRSCSALSKSAPSDFRRATPRGLRARVHCGRALAAMVEGACRIRQPTALVPDRAPLDPGYACYDSRRRRAYPADGISSSVPNVSRVSSTAGPTASVGMMMCCITSLTCWD